MRSWNLLGHGCTDHPTTTDPPPRPGRFPGFSVAVHQVA
jgi:hypothetical protein